MTETPGSVRTRCLTMLPGLQPAERLVAGFFAEQGDRCAQMTAQAVADETGTSAATVVRTCQTLGFRGYQQIRVLLARDALTAAQAEQRPDPDAGEGEAVLAHIRDFALLLPSLLSTLDAQAVEAALALMRGARRILIIASGLSSSLRHDLMSRLLRLGVDVSAPSDVLDQHVAARLLHPGDLAVVLSGSGANSHSLQAARAAHESGSSILLLTNFSGTALTEIADVSLIMASSGNSFGRELTETSRAPLALLIESLALVLRDSPAQDDVLTAVAEHIED